MNLKQLWNQKKSVVISGCVLALVLIVMSIGFMTKKAEGSSYIEISDDSSNIDSDVVSEPSKACELRADVSGAVNNPGVHCLDSRAIVIDLIDTAGGFAANYCKKWVDRELNLSEDVTPNSKLYIPSVDDAECISVQLTTESQGVSSVVEGKCSDGKININSASVEVLDEISGVGPSTAQKIIDGRPYEKIEDITNVKGIGESTFAKLWDQICL